MPPTLGWRVLDGVFSTSRGQQQPLIIIVSQVPANLRSTMADPGTFTALHIAVTALVTAAAEQRVESFDAVVARAFPDESTRPP